MGLRAWWKQAPFGIRREAWMVLRCLWAVLTRGNYARTGKGRAIFWVTAPVNRWASPDVYPWKLGSESDRLRMWKMRPRKWQLEEFDVPGVAFSGVKWHTPIATFLVGYDRDA